MSRDEERRALERFVAGLPVDADALATAITTKAVDRAIVVEALLNGLAHPEPAVRRRAARRIASMRDLDERVAARLAVLVETDEDERSREAIAAALRKHRLEVPGEAAAKPPARAPLALLRLKPSRTRSSRAQPGIALVAAPRKDAPEFLARVHDEGEGRLRFELTDLPEPFEGTRPVLRARTEPGAGELTPIARASTPVTDGAVTIIARLERPPADVDTWLDHGVDVVGDD